MNNNTPDTEGEAYGRGYKQGRFDSEMDRLNEGPATPETNYCDSMTPEEREAQSKIKVTYTTSNTPDTELKKHAQRADYFEPDTLVMTLDNIDLLLTYRDTYWKERVEEAWNEGMESRQAEIDFLRDEAYGENHFIPVATPITNEDNLK